MAERGSALVSADWLKSRLASPGIVVLDATVWLSTPLRDGDFRAISGWQTWSEHHIPTARHADLIDDFADRDAATHFARPDAAVLAQQVAELGVNAEDTVVIYDRDGGIWAARLWWMLRAIGVDARVLDGGWTNWLASGGPVVKGTESQSYSPVRGNFLLNHVDRECWVDLDEVERVVAGDAEGALICALGSDAFTGAVPTRYARRGHIPGSTNVPARAVVDDQRQLLPREQLHELLAPLVSDPGPLLVYCGGGISACLLALALTELGRGDVRVYDGSLDEWTADPRLPVSGVVPQ
ncbi:sulfurtransferase [Mycolicibacterium sp. CH28]|uniref:sulfurtransferase n=1 Tax=Mycolicibacterium sp. CH28 TaxID=2512237 RepID=UPI0010804A4C|nr:rhodanese-like domain-containing protein [Mycolicibacterium sp. CH28]TGD90672.1 sulfurtransferase [Mycolicibacterium sp. CH28]